MDRSHQLSEGETCPVHQTAYQEAQSRVHATGTNVLPESDARHNRSRFDSTCSLSSPVYRQHSVALRFLRNWKLLTRNGEEKKGNAFDLFECFLLVISTALRNPFQSPKCFQRRGERKGARRCATRPAQGSLIGRTRVKVPATVGKITTNGRNVGKSRYARKRNGRVINLSHSHTLLSFSRGDITDIAAWLHVDFCTKIRPAISRGGLFSAEQNTSRVTFLLLLPSRTRIPTFPGSGER